MQKYKLLVMTRPVPGREEDYHHWYQHIHLPELMTYPGFTSARRYRTERVLTGDPWPNMAIYEIETDDIDAVFATVNAANEAGALTLSDAVDEATAYTVVYEEFGEPVSAA